MAEKVVLILGAKGFLGTSLTRHLEMNSSFKILTHSQSVKADFQTDLSCYDEVDELLKKSEADFCVNAMALTDVNLCEEDKEKAYKLNVAPVKNLVRTVLKNGLRTKLVQISTDHMYDENNSSEIDIKLVNNYALTKYTADEISQLMDAVVLRTNFFGASAVQKKSFSDWIIESLTIGKTLQGFSDVYFSPLHISTLCEKIEKVLLNFSKGIYNLGSREGISKYEFMLQLSRHKNLLGTILPVEYRTAHMAVARPRDMRMNVKKFEQAFKSSLPLLQDEIKKC